MRVSKKIISRTLTAICLFTFTASAGAQETTPLAPAAGSSANLLLILMAVIIAVLAFVIWGMGQVLVTLGQQLIARNKQQNKAVSILMLALLSLLSFQGKAQVKAAETINTLPNYGGLGSMAFWMIATVVAIEVITIIYLMFMIDRIKSELLPGKQKVSKPGLYALWVRLDKKLFTKAVAVEKEADILLDHDYDGIRELDNSLPPWWKYGFVLTIGVACIYLLNFHVFGYGKNPGEEYQEEIVKAAEAKELYEAKNKDRVNEQDLKMPDAGGLTAASEIFSTVCWACHGKQGEGGAGPNLTDDYWLHKGSLTDIYFSIKHGYPEKGMQGWEKNYSPKQINNLAGYIKTLRGSKPPNAKAPQGDLFLYGTDSSEVKQAGKTTGEIGLLDKRGTGTENK